MVAVMSNLPSTIFDRPRLERLKQAYAKALRDDAAEFTFEGIQLVTSYAKYLIEYLETRLGESKP